MMILSIFKKILKNKKLDEMDCKINEQLYLPLYIKT